MAALVVVGFQTTAAQALLAAPPVTTLAQRSYRTAKAALIDNALGNSVSQRVDIGWRNDPVHVASVSVRNAASAATWYAATGLLARFFDTHTAPTCGRDDVEDMFDDLSAGDTGVIPAGTCSWST